MKVFQYAYERIKTKTSLVVAEMLLVTLTTMLIVYGADELIFRTSFDISSSIYGLFAFSLVILSIANGVYLCELRDATQKKFLISNRLLLLMFIVFIIFFVLADPATADFAEEILTTISVGIFYMVGIRLLQINDVPQEISVNPIKYD